MRNSRAISTSGGREPPGLEGGWNVGGGGKAHELVRIGSREQRPSERVVERMTGLERRVLSDHRMTEQIQVADRVQHLVLDELVVVAQALAVQHARVVEHDRVLQAAAERETRRAQGFDI